MSARVLDALRGMIGLVQLVQNRYPDFPVDNHRVIEAMSALNEAESTPSATRLTMLTLDNERQVFFYEQDHYYLSNFSAFSLRWRGFTFPTSEHAYQWEKFAVGAAYHAAAIQEAPSAHEAFKYAENNKADRRSDWDAVKVGVMRDILRAKASQHEYVRRKLIQTGDRVLIENSWRDAYWGWGENRDGLNMLGKLWMEVRAEYVSSSGKS